MALGMLLVIVGGNIDLSVGSVVGFVGAIAATLMVDYKMPWVPVVGRLAGRWAALIGAAQGYFVAYAKIPSFIVTLGGMLIFRGLTGNMLLGQFVGPFPKAFQTISAGFIPDFSDFPASERDARQAGSFHWGSMLIGIVGAAVLMLVIGLRRWRRAQRRSRWRPSRSALFIGKNADLRRADPSASATCWPPTRACRTC